MRRRRPRRERLGSHDLFVPFLVSRVGCLCRDPCDVPRFLLYECANSVTHGERRLARLLSFSPDLVQFDRSQTFFKLSFYIPNLRQGRSA